MKRHNRNTRTLTDPRELALRCLLEVDAERVLVPEAMSRIPFQLDEPDRALAHEIVYGTFRFLPGLESQLASLLRRPKCPTPIRWLLLMSLYQLGYLRVPDYAVLNEANKLTVKLKLAGLKGLVNGILRNVVRQGPAFWEGARNADRLLPAWLATRFSDQYGAATLAEWAEHWQRPALLSYWTVSGKGCRSDARSDLLPHAFRTEKQLSQRMLTRERAYIQNESSQALAELVCRTGARSVLDLCAAPGGKSCYIAAFGNADRLVACDIGQVRMARLLQNQQRLGLEFETRVSAAADLEFAPASFECVLVDAPCTGLGILGRHPEIKYLKREPADEGLCEQQAALMATGWHFVKPGGFLLYAVCSLDRSEIPSLPSEAEMARDDWGQWLPSTMTSDWERGFYIPPTGICDGFQAVLLRKPLT